MVVTPSATSGALAGFSIWAVFWSMVFKLDKLAKLFGLGGFVDQDAVFRWINKNKTITVIGTECVNFGVHGVSNANSATFVIGGTLFNLFMVMLGVPAYCLKSKVFGKKKKAW